jgi:hypothetical protein
MQQRVSAAQRALRAVERRKEFRSTLNELERHVFDRFPIMCQEVFIKVMQEYPDSVPKDIPDPFAGPQREPLWRLNYATRAGIRLSPVV